MSDILTLSKKVLLLGDPAVGKTSLIRKFVYDMFDDKYISTLGTKISRKRLEYNHPNNFGKIELKLMIWDVMGQKEYEMVHQSAYLGGQGALIICDLTRHQTLENTENWISSLYTVTGEIPIVIIGNKCDLTNQKQIELNDIEQRAKTFNVPIFLASAKTGENVEISFRTLGERIVKADYGG